MTLYKLLNDHSKNWFYFKQLRQQQKNKEARIKERESIKSLIQNLRFVLKNKGILTIGRGGFTLHCGVTEKSVNSTTKTSISGYDSEFYKEVCLKLGIPIVDTRKVDVIDLVKNNFPIVNLEIEKSEESSGGYKTLHDFINIHEKLNNCYIFRGLYG